MADNNTANVGIGAAGKVYIAPKGTELPTDATSTLSGSFVNFGYVSDAGVTMNESSSANTLRDWGGEPVVTTVTEHSEGVSFTPIEINETVLKALYGDDNVTVTAGTTGASGTPTKILAKHKGQTMPQVVIVIDAVPNDNIKARYVMPLAQLTARGDATLTGKAFQGREMTYTASADTSGVTMYEYVAVPAGA